MQPGIKISDGMNHRNYDEGDRIGLAGGKR